MKDKIIIVDDEEHIRTIYSEKLADEGYQVATCQMDSNSLKN